MATPQMWREIDLLLGSIFGPNGYCGDWTEGDEPEYNWILDKGGADARWSKMPKLVWLGLSGFQDEQVELLLIFSASLSWNLESAEYFRKCVLFVEDYFPGYQLYEEIRDWDGKWANAEATEGFLEGNCVAIPLWRMIDIGEVLAEIGRITKLLDTA